MKHVKTKIGLIIAVFIVGLFAVALANDGNGSVYGNHMMGPEMMGYGMGYHNHMMAPWTEGNINLSVEDTAKLRQAREEFLNETRELRDTIEQKQLALNQELRKTDPDRDRAFDLQKELSKLESEFDQKALENQLDLRKTFPDTAFAMGNWHEEDCW